MEAGMHSQTEPIQSSCALTTQQHDQRHRSTLFYALLFQATKDFPPCTFFTQKRKEWRNKLYSALTKTCWQDLRTGIKHVATMREASAMVACIDSIASSLVEPQGAMDGPMWLAVTGDMLPRESGAHRLIRSLGFERVYEEHDAAQDIGCGEAQLRDIVNKYDAALSRHNGALLRKVPAASEGSGVTTVSDYQASMTEIGKSNQDEKDRHWRKRLREEEKEEDAKLQCLFYDF